MKKAEIHTEKGLMKVEFYHKDAPKTVENFIKYGTRRKKYRWFSILYLPQ